VLDQIVLPDRDHENNRLFRLHAGYLMVAMPRQPPRTQIQEFAVSKTPCLRKTSIQENMYYELEHVTVELPHRARLQVQFGCEEIVRRRWAHQKPGRKSTKWYGERVSATLEFKGKCRVLGQFTARIINSTDTKRLFICNITINVSVPGIRDR